MINFFYKAETVIKDFKEELGLDISEQFILCAADKLTLDFEMKTGIKPTNVKLISFTPTRKGDTQYVKGAVSTIKDRMYVNHNWNDVSWSWHTKSGRIIDIGDKNFDCDDLVVYFNNLDALLIQKQMYPKEALPFKLKDLKYELTIERLNQEMTIEATFRDSLANKELVQQDALAFVAKFNEKLLKKNYSGVHNFQPRVEGYKIVFDIDTGATGPVFLKQFLKFLSDQDVFERVEVI